MLETTDHDHLAQCTLRTNNPGRHRAAMSLAPLQTLNDGRLATALPTPTPQQSACARQPA
eukprot:9491955-Pyramimonas_sp.AAC.1